MMPELNYKALKNIILLPSVGFLLMASLSNCASNDTPAVPTMLWPDPPDQPRIELVDILDNDSYTKGGTSDQIKSIFFGASATKKLLQPASVAADLLGNVYVTDSGAGKIVVFNKQAKTRLEFGERGKAALQWPTGIVLSDSLIYVSDARQRKVICMTHQGEFVRNIGGDDELVKPSGLGYHATTNRVYVTDGGSHSIAVFDAGTGAHLFNFGQRGVGPGEFNFPNNLTVSHDQVYVIDAMNFRVQIFDLEGNFLKEFGEAGDSAGYLYRPKGISVSEDKFIFITDASYNNFQIFDEDGNVYLFVGGKGTSPGQFNIPSDIFISAENMIYVVDQRNDRVQVFKFLGGD